MKYENFNDKFRPINTLREQRGARAHARVCRFDGRAARHCGEYAQPWAGTP